MSTMRLDAKKSDLSRERLANEVAGKVVRAFCFIESHSSAVFWLKKSADGSWVRQFALTSKLVKLRKRCSSRLGMSDSWLKLTSSVSRACASPNRDAGRLRRQCDRYRRRLIGGGGGKRN